MEKSTKLFKEIYIEYTCYSFKADKFFIFVKTRNHKEIELFVQNTYKLYFKTDGLEMESE